MKYPILALILTMVSLASCSHSPRFHYNDCLRVTDGFYEGSTGIASDYVYETRRVRLNFVKINGVQEYDSVSENEVVLVKRNECVQ